MCTLSFTISNLSYISSLSLFLFGIKFPKRRGEKYKQAPAFFDLYTTIQIRVERILNNCKKRLLKLSFFNGPFPASFSLLSSFQYS